MATHSDQRASCGCETDELKPWFRWRKPLVEVEHVLHTATTALLRVGRAPMIKDVMVWVDGSLADEIRLDVAGSIARKFESRVIALVLNPMPTLGSMEILED